MPVPIGLTYVRVCVNGISIASPANTIHLNNVDTMLAHRLRRWPNIVPALGERLMLAGSEEAALREQSLYTQKSITLWLRCIHDCLINRYKDCAIISHSLIHTANNNIKKIGKLTCTSFITVLYTTCTWKTNNVTTDIQFKEFDIIIASH